MRFVVDIQHVKDVGLLQAAGADVVVAATEKFSAYTLHPFTNEMFFAAKQECRKTNVLFYADMTAMFVDDDMQAIHDHLLFLKGVRVDGIYFSDMAVYMSARELGMEQLCIYQPDTLITNALDAAAYLEQSIAGVCAAKELTLEELKAICSYNPDRVEVFLHGRALMSQSKRKLLSNYFASSEVETKQPPYYFMEEETRQERCPILENEHGTYMFAAYDVWSFQEVMFLLQSKVGALRISSIFTDTTESILALRLYRKVLACKLTGQEAMQSLVSMYPQKKYQSGFYYTKTGIKKEEVEPSV